MNILYKKFLPTSFEVCFEVHEPQNGMRLDQFLQRHFLSFSREQIKEKIRQGDVEIVGRPGKPKPNSKVYYKEKVISWTRKTIHEDEWWNGEKIPLELEPQILYEDDRLFVLHKPPFMATHPTGKHLFYCATVYLEGISGKGTHSVHRLDRETSGVLLVAKNPQAAKFFTSSFENELVAKCYFFIGMINDQFKENFQFRASERLDTGGEGLKRVVIGYYPEESQEGKRAETDFLILHRENNVVLGLAFPQTGRQHQIRVHALAHGFPLLGDKIYYGSYPLFQRFKDQFATAEDHNLMQIPRHALHATAINIPWDKENRRTFFCPLPHDLSNWIKKNLTLSLDDFMKKIENNIKDYFDQKKFSKKS